MTGYEVGYGAVLFSSAIFILISIALSPFVRSPQSFFHNPSVSQNIISLIVANVTLGTGIVYLVNGGQQNGMLMLCVPVATLAGYMWLAREVTKANTSMKLGQNVLGTAQDILDKTFPNDPVPYARVVTAGLVFVYTLALAYELIASPLVIAPFVTPNPGSTAYLFITAAIFLGTLFTVLFGGLRAVFRTDVLQLVGVAAVVIMLLASTLNAMYRVSAPSTPSPILKLDLSTVLSVSLACIAAVTTQFYSILNWATISHTPPERRAQVLRQVGVWVAIILTVFISCGIAAQSKGLQLTQLISTGYAPLGQSSSVYSWLIAAILGFGLASVVCSTCDSLMIALVQFVYDNILRLSSNSTGENRVFIQRIRISTLVAFLLIFLSLVALYRFRNDLFTLLLALASCLVVLMPLFLLLTRLVSTPDALKVLKRWTLWTYTGLFLAAAVAAAYAMLRFPSYVPVVGLIGLLVSSLFTAFLWRQSLPLTKDLGT